ncbi:hypothetical protein [Vibrio harveyi]|uniref:hypothetical protein n=1 Tax=Vibrio harveyi TaxID=669 RepID=UPI00217DF69B|nr:hypothetical protein [Vibrio harveyi]
MTDVCKHCGKGSNHFTDWDFPEGDKNGVGECKNSERFGGCVGDWACHYTDKQAEWDALSPKQKLEIEITKLEDELYEKVTKLESMGN